jgi:hypothetical protein
MKMVIKGRGLRACLVSIIKLETQIKQSWERAERGSFQLGSMRRSSEIKCILFKEFLRRNCSRRARRGSSTTFSRLMRSQSPRSILRLISDILRKYILNESL